MALTRTVYDEEVLLTVLQEMEEPNFFFRNFFPSAIQADTDTIEFSMVTEKRHIAPFVLPTVEGRPMLNQRESARAFKPGYIKIKDQLSAIEVMRPHAGFGELLRKRKMTEQQRHDALVALTLRLHMNAIMRREELMCSEIVLNGSTTVVGDSYPSVTIDYQRDSGHTITKASGERWGDSGVSILDDIEKWNNTMGLADFGGSADMIVMGLDAWAAFSKDDEIWKHMNMDYRNSAATQFDMGVSQGMRMGAGMTRCHMQDRGVLRGGLRVVTYSDYYHTAAGTQKFFMDKRDILMISPSFDGVRAYGAIADKGAMWHSLPMFSKMWDEDDPSATTVMTQAGPLPIAVTPNRTLRARVVA